ncbi:unnamed protein product [Triticum turgidum subsp. durum]|uniref:Anaphase-promoting complex subunit 4 WD40 domain-containing protein n=1 Tax=Triticum turgidum subsp. durum TaxID=4567 RepID=A0A9R0V1R8_TRITD|nr:unnamed protein product [Triticum turgidum subsp. durum]
MSWVPRGAAKSVPIEAEPPTKEEIEEAMKKIALGREAGSDADDADGDEDDDAVMEVDGAEDEEVDEVAQAKAAAKALGTKSSSGSAAVGDVSDGLAELNMDAYDDEEDGLELFSTGLGDLYYKSNEEDPYIIKNEEDVSIVEELEDGDPNMFVHHEVPLSDFPLCTAWMDFNRQDGEQKGNFIAVGTMDPTIEIWNLDVVDEVEPHYVLGGVSKKKKKVKGKKGKTYKKGSHRSSVLGLAWNTVVRNALASASADKTVKVWDLSAGKCLVTLQHHDDKVIIDTTFFLNSVQSVAWRSPEVLLSGSFDRTIAMTDMKDSGQCCHKWPVEADVESLVCDPHNEHSFVVSLENGMVQVFDIRTASSNSNPGQPIFTLHAHEKAVSSISFAPSTPNFLATGSTDKMVKLWDLSNNQPSCVSSLNPKLGAIFSVSFSIDNPFLLACGGSKGKLKVWNTLSEPAVANKFGKYSTISKYFSLATKLFVCYPIGRIIDDIASEKIDLPNGLCVKSKCRSTPEDCVCCLVDNNCHWTMAECSANCV